MSVELSSALLHPLDAAAGVPPILAVKIHPHAVTNVARRSFHLALLLDTSGSMDGERIESLRRTLHLLIDEIADGDMLSFIQYSNRARAIASAKTISAESRTELHNLVDTLTADGGTNMSEAIECLRTISGRDSGVGAGAAGSEPIRPPVDAIFILTDGQVNAGITSANGLLHILNSAVDRGTPVNTLGYGSDHNSSLLRSMAVRSRGTYTFADVSEMLPAIIGNIIGGLANEIGRNTSLVIPAGWKCLEIGALVDQDYTVGTLIDDKPQWVVLEGPVDCTELPTIRLNWLVGSREYVEECGVSDSIGTLEVAEQYERCRTVAVFETVEGMIERHDIAAARVALEAHAAELDASDAKDSPLVVRLRAQVEDMLQSLNTLCFPGGVGLPGAIGGNRMNSGPVITRLASNITAIGVQRGFLSGGTTVTRNGTDPVGDPLTLDYTFSSPAQRNATQTMTVQFSTAAEPHNDA